MMNLRLSLATLILLVPAFLAAVDPSEGADPLAIAAVLIRDGNLARAEAILDQVNPSDKGLDQARWRTLQGLVALRSARYADAEARFRQAKALGQKDSNLDASLAQALYAQGKYADTLAVLGAFPRLNAFPDLLGMKAQAEWSTGLRSQAVDTLDRAIRVFPKQLTFLQTKIAFMLELNLTQEAAALSRQYLDRAGRTPGAWLTIGESLRRGKQPQTAVLVLETARLAFPGQVKILLSLAQAYLDQGMVRTAARFVEEAGTYEAAYLAQAADLHKRAKDYSRALFLNALVADPKAKARQRFSILIDAGRFEEALVLVPRLEQMGLLVDQKLKYAAAFASFRAQRYGPAQALVAAISDPGLFAASVQLRKAIEASRSDPVAYF